MKMVLEPYVDQVINLRIKRLTILLVAVSLIVASLLLMKLSSRG